MARNKQYPSTFTISWMVLNIHILGLLLANIVLCKDPPLPSRSFVMPTIFWDPRNPIFNCPNKGINTINLRLNDYIQFACPKEGRTIDWHESLGHSYLHMFENAFYTENQTAVEHCTAGDSWPFFLRCNDPLNGNIFRTIRVSKYSANDADPKFVYNLTSYLFSTGTGESAGLNNRVGGRCRGHKVSSGYVYNMTLRLRVCPEGTAGTPECPICMTAACYNRGCGNYMDWSEEVPKKLYREVTNLYNDSVNSVSKSLLTINRENKCFVYKSRKCDDSTMGCTGPDLTQETVSCPSVEVVPNYINCTSLIYKMYHDMNGTCVNISQQNCTIGSLEKFQVTRWHKHRISCPATPPPPTTPQSTTPKTKPNSTDPTTKSDCNCTGANSRRSGSQNGDPESTDYLKYIIPIVSAIFGCICGAVSVLCYKRSPPAEKSRISSDTESNGTAETVFDGGISNKAFGTQSIKKKGSTVDYSA